MYFKFLIMSVFLISPPAFAQEAWLSVQPSKCVSIREGRICHADVVISWQASSDQELCIVNRDVSEPILCWLDNTRGQHELDFNQSETTTFQLIERKTRKVLAETDVKVSWVYSKNKERSGWRLF